MRRAIPALEERCAAHGEGTILVVAHQTLLRLLLCTLLDISLDRYRALLPRLDNVARTVVRVHRCAGDAPRAALLALNVPASA